jgi:hypothetical protein
MDLQALVAVLDDALDDQRVGGGLLDLLNGRDGRQPQVLGDAEVDLSAVGVGGLAT